MLQLLDFDGRRPFSHALFGSAAVIDDCRPDLSRKLDRSNFVDTAFAASAFLETADFSRGASWVKQFFQMLTFRCAVVGLDRASIGYRVLLIFELCRNLVRFPLNFFEVSACRRFIDYFPSLLESSQFSTIHALSVIRRKDQRFRRSNSMRIYKIKACAVGLRRTICRSATRFSMKIDAAIRLRDKVLLILSEHLDQKRLGRGRSHQGVRGRDASAARPCCFPIRLDDAVMDTKEAWAANCARDTSATSGAGRSTTNIKRASSACCAI